MLSWLHLPRTKRSTLSLHSHPIKQAQNWSLCQANVTILFSENMKKTHLLSHQCKSTILLFLSLTLSSLSRSSISVPVSFALSFFLLFPPPYPLSFHLSFNLFLVSALQDIRKQTEWDRRSRELLKEARPNVGPEMMRFQMELKQKMQGWHNLLSLMAALRLALFLYSQITSSPFKNSICLWLSASC